MITLRHTMVWIAAAILCLGFGTVATAGYIYDFDNGQVTGAVDPGITLIGQDNWNEFIDREDLKVRNDMGGDPGITGLAGYQNTLTSYSTRVNNGNFNYSIPAATEFRIEFNLLVGTGAADTFGLAVDLDGDGDVERYTDEIAFRFGAGIITSGKTWYIRQGWTDAGAGTEIGSSTGPSAGETWRIVLDVDPTFDNGNGAGSMSVQLLSGAGGVLTPVSDLQGINLGLNGLTKSDPSEWDALFVSIGVGAAVDDLTITPVPEPGAGLLLILGLTGFGLFLRRR